MKKMLSIALAMLVTMSIVGTGKAYAANLTNPIEINWTPQSVRVYKDGHVHHLNSDGSVRTNDYTDLAFEGNTLKISGEYRESDVSTVKIIVQSYDNETQQSTVTEYATNINDSKYRIDIDMTEYKKSESMCMRIEYGKWDEPGYYSDYLNRVFDASYSNGKWQFTTQMLTRFVEDANIVKDVQVDLDEYWRYQDKWYADFNGTEQSEGRTEQAAIKAKALELCQGAKSDTEKAYRVYKWISDTFNPREDIGYVDGIQTPFICQNYSRTWNAFMYYMGIPSVEINGITSFGEHVFNVVYLDGHWSLVDCYLDDINTAFDMTFDEMLTQDFDMWSCNITSYKTPDAPPDNSIKAKYNILNFKVNGSPIPTSLATYNINNNNYVKLRDIAKLMSTTNKKFSVNWDNANQCISIQTGANYVSVGGEMQWTKYKLDQHSESVLITEGYAVPSTAKVYLNGQALNLQVYTIDNNNYFKLRDIAEKVNFAVGCENNTITINTYKGYSK